MWYDNTRKFEPSHEHGDLTMDEHLSKRLAVDGGAPAVTRPFPNWPLHDELEATLLKEVLDSGTWWKATGTQVRKFEQDFAHVHGASYGLAVTNGTHALELALRALNIGEGDEVIIPSMTFIATATAVFCAGACPVAVDVQKDTWCLDPDAIESAITPSTRAVIAVHFAGHVADMEHLAEVCHRHGIYLIEDACHAHGARWNGKPAGSFGVAAAFSFQNFKLMTAGEGGMLLINDDRMYERAILCSNCGRPPDDTVYNHVVLGSNYRMSEFQGAVLNAQLTRLERLAEHRERIAQYLDKLLEGVLGVRPQGRDARVSRHAHYMYVFEYDPEYFAGLPRAQFVEALKAEGIPTYRMYPRVQDTTFYGIELAKRGLLLDRQPECPVGLAISMRGVWIHHRVLLGDEGMVEQVRSAMEKVRGGRCDSLNLEAVHGV
jgi:3-amino-5-hydroxybenzoate synthase